MRSMSEAEYLQLARHITEKLDNTAEYEDWLMIQDYVDELQGNLTKEQLAYINLKKTFDEQHNENQQLKSQNEELKQKLNWIAFGDDPELALRYLRKIGYVDFDEERKVYINRHNNELFLLDDEEEKDFYIPDEELNEYTEQLEYQLKQRDDIINKVKEFIAKDIQECTYKQVEKYQELLETLEEENKC